MQAAQNEGRRNAHRLQAAIRVFVGPVEIAGYYGRLASSLRGLGIDAVAVDLSAHRFKYVTQTDDEGEGFWIRAAKWAEQGSARNRGRRGTRRLAWRVLRVLTRIFLVAWSVRRFDAFIFGFGKTMLFGIELPILRLLRKRLIFTFNGSDARPPYIDGADMAPSRKATIDDCIRLARRRKAHLRRVERYAHAVVSLPTFSHFFERPVIDYLRVGTPCPPTAGGVHEAGDEIVVVHTPSDPEVKASDRIRATVQEMIDGGYRMRLVELRDVTNAEVRSQIAGADFVIDQLYSDTPMAVFASEAAAAGVPAIVGSYAWPYLRTTYPERVLPPVEPCHPDELAKAVHRLASDKEYRLKLGARARSFTQREWSGTEVASRYLAILHGDVPKEWLFDPKTLDYVHGAGLAESRSREIVAAVLARGGLEALQVGDKPALEQAFVKFAEGR